MAMTTRDLAQVNPEKDAVAYVDTSSQLISSPQHAFVAPTVEGMLLMMRDRDGADAAFHYALAMVKENTQQMTAWVQSCFYEMRELDGGRKKLWPTTEADVSRAYDLADCNDGEIPVFLYQDDDGTLYPIAVSKSKRVNTDEEAPFHYASAEIFANGKAVGHVRYTDH
jgi:hypothetical protein